VGEGRKNRRRERGVMDGLILRLTNTCNFNMILISKKDFYTANNFMDERFSILLSIKFKVQ